MTNERMLAEIDSVLIHYKLFLQTTQDFRQSSTQQEERILALLNAAIARLSPPHSPYSSQAEVAMQLRYADGEVNTIQKLAGILEALESDYEHDRIRRFQELVHSGLFNDMLEAAEYLLGESYKDPAAVMAGGVLEQHLRELCQKHGIDTKITSGKGGSKPKKLDTMNADLAKQATYGKIEQKQVTSWAGVRNAAAHGEYGTYDEHQVQQMIAGIRGFIIRYPA